METEELLLLSMLIILDVHNFEACIPFPDGMTSDLSAFSDFTNDIETCIPTKKQQHVPVKTHGCVLGIPYVTI